MLTYKQTIKPFLNNFCMRWAKKTKAIHLSQIGKRVRKATNIFQYFL